MTQMSDTPQDRSADGVPETPERRAARHALDRPLIKAFRALTPDPHPMENCGPLLLRLAPGDSCPTCGTVPPITPAEQRTGVSDVQASIADEVAALRADIMDPLATTVGMLARLDRIAALVPQRATDADEFSKGDALWLHDCGGVMPGYGESKPDECPRHWCNGGEWRALYTVAGH